MEATVLLLIILLLTCSIQAESLRHSIYDAPLMSGTQSHAREQRSDAVKSPMYVSPNKAYLQSSYAYELSCTVANPDDLVSVIFWLKGKSQDPASQKLILRHSFPDDGNSFVASPLYQLSPSRGIVIDPVSPNDTDWYWCKTKKGSSEKLDEDYLDVTVLDNRFPSESISTSNVTTSRRLERDSKIDCPGLAQKQSQSTVTLYWSVFNDEEQSLDIVLAKFSDGEMLTFDPYAGRYSLGDDNSLAVEKFTRREERYCCHVFERGSDLQTGCVDVTWLTDPVRYPSILGCDSTDGNTCYGTLTPNQDCVRLECSIRDVYPKPALNWSFTDCDGGATPIFVLTSSVTNNSATETYSVSARLYVVELKPDEVCKFSCMAAGETIINGSSLSDAIITGLDKDTTTATTLLVIPDRVDCNCEWTKVVLLTMLLVVLFLILVIGVVLAFPRNRRFIQNHVNDFPTFPCLVNGETDAAQEMAPMKQVTDLDENARNAEQDSNSSSEQNDDKEIQVETSPMLTIENEENGVPDVVKEGRLCLVIRGDPDVLITDSKHKWRPMGEFVTETVLADESGSGFKAIKDVICTQDGGLVVIDASGLHHFNSAYNYHFVDLNKLLWDDNYCSVAHHSGNKVLFGLSRGKIVQCNIQNGQISNFGSVTRVRYTDVHLADLSVDGLGFVFAGDRNGKAVSVFDDSGGCLTRMEIAIEPASLCAHARNELQSLFVSSGVAVKKYNIVKSSTNAKILPQIRFTIDKEVLEVPKFHSGYVTVQGGKLFVVNHLEVGEYLQVLELDAAKGTREHSFFVDVLGLRGVKFMESDRIVVYTDDAVYLFERGGSPMEGSPKW